MDFLLGFVTGGMVIGLIVYAVLGSTIDELEERLYGCYDEHIDAFNRGEES